MEKQMLEKEILERIDKLFESVECYVIDFLPEQMINVEFFELEKYFLENYLSDFSKKISYIIIKLIKYFSSEIYVIEYEGESILSDNYADKGIKEIVNIIVKVIKRENNNHTCIQIILKGDNTFLININSEFSVSIYNLSNKDLSLITMLVQQEGLFLRKV